MSGIDDLRQTGAKENKVPVRVQIGDSESKNPEISNRIPRSSHTFVPDNTREKILAQQKVLNQEENKNRVTVDLTSMNLPKSETETAGVEIRENFVTDILEGEDSIFGKYIKEKEEEAKQWMEEKAMEEEIEGKNEKSEDGSNVDEDGEDYTVGTDSLSEQSLDDMIEEDQSEYSISEEDFKEEMVADNIEEDEYDEPQEETTVEETDSTIQEESEKEIATEDDTSVSIDESELELEVSEVKSNTTLDLDIQDEKDEAAQEEEEQESINHLRDLAIERLKPISKRLDISSFTVAKKPVRNLSNLLSQTTVKAAKWVLPNQQCIVLMKEFLGSELESMRANSEDNRNLSMLFRKYRAVYDHIVSKKPATYEAWLKSTPFSDIDHYMFAVYISSFKGANYLPADCQEKNCGESFLTNDIPILDMVKFKDDDTKKKFINLYQSETQTNGKGLYLSEIIPLSERIAIGFKEPSIYGYFESISIDDRFRAKYASIIDLIPYIDSLYIIDGTNLLPVGYKIYADNVNKSIRSKIATYAKILSTLSVDEFTPIRSYIREIMERGNQISYIYPSVTCPKCGKATREIPATAEELVFIRYQLGALANSSLK